MYSCNKASYKLHYFDIRGRGDVIRQLFAVAGQDFEDNRIPMDFAAWGQIKNNYQFGQVPVLEVNGKCLSQQHAICRYLAKQFGFAGRSDWERAQVDALADQVKDFFSAQAGYWAVGVIKIRQGDVEAAKQESLIPAVKQHFPFFVKAIEANGSGYFVGSNFTWVDILFAELFNTLAMRNPELEKDYPLLAALRDKIHSIPRIKAFRESIPRDF